MRKEKVSYLSPLKIPEPKHSHRFNQKIPLEIPKTTSTERKWQTGKYLIGLNRE